MKRLSGYLLCISIWLTTSATAQPVTFHDANLKATVETALGFSDPNSSDMLMLTNLYAQSSGISDLTGLESAVNLKALYLNNNQIMDAAFN